MLTRLLQVYGSSETAGVGWRDDPAGPYALLPGWRRDGDGLLQGHRAIQPPDLLEWRDDDRFRVLGRRDGAVQVAGFNVVPDQVRAALARHPAVADIAVRPMRPKEGSRLKAFVVPAAVVNPDELLADWVAGRGCEGGGSSRLEHDRRQHLEAGLGEQVALEQADA